jgi:hypothetical protein
VPAHQATSPPDKAPDASADKKRTRRRSARWAIVLLVLIGALAAARAFLPSGVRWYVNRTIDQSPLYDGHIGDVDMKLWRGAYSIEDVRIVKTTGNVPVPFYAAERVDFAIEWRAILSRKLVGRVAMLRPQLNFVDGEDQSDDQTGAGGPWLEIIRDLFPFRIDSAQVRDGSIHFRAFDSQPPVDVYLSQVNASVENLTNIGDDVAPLISTINATALAMDDAKIEYRMKLNPFSYRPTFQMALRLVGLDVTKANALTRAYGAFDYERGWFDLVVELDAKEGRLEGYVKPMFRDVRVLSLRDDLTRGNVIQAFWEALVGGVSELLENQPRDQFATIVPLRGELDDPRVSLLSTIGNILHNAFVRAYLPRLEGEAETIDELQFDPGTAWDPASADLSS